MKRKMPVILLAFFIAVGFLTAAAGAQAAADPGREIEETINRLVSVVAKYPGDKNREERHETMREVISPKFDFKEMARRSLGKYWDRVSETERQEFVDVFSDLLAATYLKRLDAIEEGMVKVKGQKERGNKALIRTSVNYKDDVFPIDYKMVNRDGGWKVYDVIIENIGLVSNYRTEFAGIIRREQFAGLMKRLREKAAGIT